MARPFTDTDLRRLERKSSQVLLYSWSPHMNLSVRGLDQALEAARHGGARVVAVLDPGCNRELAASVARDHGWSEEVLRIDESRELIDRGFRVHFPSYLFVSKGMIRGSVIPGYKTAAELEWFRRKAAP